VAIAGSNQQHEAMDGGDTLGIRQQLEDTPTRSCTHKDVKDSCVASGSRTTHGHDAGFTQAFVDDLELSE